MEPAVAPLRPALLQDVVSAAAAQALAAVRPCAGLVADPAPGADRVGPRLAVAEVRRFLEVDELAVAGPAAMRGVLQLAGVAVVCLDQRGGLEALLQKRAHHPELRGHLPTCLQLAAA